MSLTRSLTLALSRSIDQAKHSIATALRFEVVAPTTDRHDHVPIYTLASMDHIQSMATGCDADIGGLSSVKIDLDPREGKGRFWGTLSCEIPRSSTLQRSGYAGFRNKNRPTLFGQQTWDSTMHPYLRLRVKNRLEKSVQQQQQQQQSTPSLRSALSSFSPNSTVSAHKKAVHALGLDLPLKAGPKFFVNVQTDGPVTSDLFQHRLTLDESKGDSWQDVIIPLNDFVLLNTGQVSPSQIGMMREKIRTVGISVMLEHPASVTDSVEKVKKATDAAPQALRAGQETVVNTWSDADSPAAEQANNTSTTPVATKRRGASYNFDLGIDNISAISEEALSGTE